jgi:hypothetical protein
MEWMESLPPIFIAGTAASSGPRASFQCNRGEKNLAKTG